MSDMLHNTIAKSKAVRISDFRFQI